MSSRGLSSVIVETSHERNELMLEMDDVYYLLFGGPAPNDI